MPKPTFFNLPGDKRDRIAEQALDEFSEHSFLKASISSIVAGAGIAKGSFYQYFSNKLDLYRWLLFEKIIKAKMAALQESPPPPDGDFFQVLEHMYLAGLRWGLENPRLAQVSGWVWRTISREPKLQKLHTELQEMTVNNIKLILRQGQRAGQVRRDIDLDLAAEVMLSISQQGFDLAMMRKVRMNLIEFCAHPEFAARFDDEAQKQVVREFISILKDGLGASEAPESDWNGKLIDLDQVNGGDQ